MRKSTHDIHQLVTQRWTVAHSRASSQCRFMAAVDAKIWISASTPRTRAVSEKSREIRIAAHVSRVTVSSRRRREMVTGEQKKRRRWSDQKVTDQREGL